MSSDWQTVEKPPLIRAAALAAERRTEITGYVGAADRGYTLTVCFHTSFGAVLEARQRFAAELTEALTKACEADPTLAKFYELRDKLHANRAEQNAGEARLREIRRDRYRLLRDGEISRLI